MKLAIDMAWTICLYEIVGIQEQDEFADFLEKLTLPIQIPEFAVELSCRQVLILPKIHFSAIKFIFFTLLIYESK